MTPDQEAMLSAFGSVDDTLDYRENYLRIPFSYVGSKSESLKHILPKLPYLNTYVEVFGGSGVVMLNRGESNLDVFNDRYSAVTDFFKVVRDNQKRDKLVERIALSPHSRQEFISNKNNWEVQEDEIERVAMWYVMVQSSFAGRGLYFGRCVKGKGSMWRKIQENLDLFQDIANRFLRIQIENLDYTHCLTDYDSLETVFFLDPPYYAHNVYKHQMSKADHVSMCERIFRCKGFVALSGYDTEVYKDFPWDSIHHWTVSDKMKTAAITTETSRVQGRTDLDRGTQEEYLFVKEVG